MKCIFASVMAHLFILLLLVIVCQHCLLSFLINHLHGHHITNHHQEVQPRIASLSIADLDRHGKKSKKKQYLFSWWPPISSMLQLHNGLWHTQTGSQSDILLLNSANTWSNSESAVDNILFGAGCPLTFVFSLRPTCWETLLPTGSFFDANHSSASEASSSSPSCCSRHDQT